MKRTALISILFVVLLVSVSFAVPPLINYQGKLKHSNGNPATGTKNMTFTLYTHPQNGLVLWSETQAVTFDDGTYSVNLGSVTPLSDSVFDADQLWVGIVVENEQEMTPRQRMTSTPYAYRAGVPSGYLILGEAPTVPVGYAATNNTMVFVNCEAKSNLPQKLSEFAAATANGKIYIFGGQDEFLNKSSSVYEYNPATNIWTAKASMTTPKNRLSAVTVNNKIYVMGGSALLAAVTDSNDEYDPLSDTWTSKAAMPEKMSAHSAIMAANKIYVMGGFNPESGEIWATNWQYNPESDTWQSLVNMPAGRFDMGIASYNNAIFLSGGSAYDNQFNNAMYVYDINSNSWTIKSPMIVGKNEHVMFDQGGRLYVFGGCTGAGGVSDVHEYDIAFDRWMQRSSMIHARRYFGGVNINGNIYVMGGHDSYDGKWKSMEKCTINIYYLYRKL